MRIALADSDGGDGTGTRLAEDVESLARHLVANGHEVTALGVSFGEGSERSGLEAVSLWRPPRLRVYRFYEEDVDLAPSAALRLARGSFEVAHAFSPALGWAAAQARRIGGPPYVFSFRGSLERRWLVERHYRLEMMRATTAAAAASTVDSEEAALGFERYLLTRAQVVDRHRPQLFDALYLAAVAAD